MAGEPLSAEVRNQQSASLRSARHDVAVAATGHMTAGPAAFLVTLGLDAREGGHRGALPAVASGIPEGRDLTCELAAERHVLAACGGEVSPSGDLAGAGTGERGDVPR